MRYQKGTFTTVPNRDVLRGRSAYTRSVYLAICDYSDELGICFPSIRTLAKDAGMSPNIVQKSINELVELGLLTKVSRSKPGNDKQKLSNYYQLMLSDSVPPGSTGMSPDDTGVYHDVIQGVLPGGTGGVSPHDMEVNTILTKPTEQKETPAQEARKFFNSDTAQLEVVRSISESGMDAQIAKLEVTKFVSYWTEKNKSGTKQKWELETTFEISRRLATWFRNAGKFNKNITQQVNAVIL